MPGIFGGTGCSRPGYEALRAYYEKAWGACEFRVAGEAAIGGHAFGAKSAVRRTEDLTLAVDGDPFSYRFVEQWARSGAGQIVVDGLMQVPARLTGNLAALHGASGVVHLGMDWAGTLPLYYVCWREGFLFANLLRPLAKIVDADADPLGVLQFLRQGYIYGNRTPFSDVYRLRPGEVLRFDPVHGRLLRKDRSNLWVGASISDPDGLPRRCLEHLERSVSANLQEVESAAIMMSGGWDSRTLLAAVDHVSGEGATADIRGFSHGDIDSRELRLASRLCQEVGLSCRLEPIRETILDPDTLRDDFVRTGLAIFPHWHRAGRVLGQSGCGSVMAGVFGEVLGGHYGRTMTGGLVGRGTALCREWLGLAHMSENDGDPVTSAWSVLKIDDVGDREHWYLADGYGSSSTHIEVMINEQIRSALERLYERGIHTVDRLIEAFITEHRGSQYIAGQTVSARVTVDASLPFGDQHLLHLASRVSPRVKLHNALNRRMLSEADGSLLDYPTAATLISTSSPLIFQEASRALRKVWEDTGWRIYFGTNGRLPLPRLGWVNFEFLRNGDALHDLVEDLRLDFWDRLVMRRRIEAIVSMDMKVRLHPYFDQFGKIYTIDLLLR